MKHSVDSLVHTSAIYSIGLIFYSSCATFLTWWKRSIWDQCKKYEYLRPTTDLRAHSHTLKNFKYS